MGSRPGVSICVPVYNGAPFVAETLVAALNQTYEPLTVLVSDDGSGDESLAICRSFAADSRVLVWRQPARLGWVANCNWLLARAESELVCIVSHDDLAEPEMISRLVRALSEVPDAALAFCDVATFGRWRRRRVWRRVAIDGTPAERVRRFMATHFDGTAFHALIRHTALDTAGGLRGNEIADFAADVSWLGRLAAVGSFVRVPESLYRKRRHYASASQRWGDWDDERRADAWALHCRELLHDALELSLAPDEQEALVRAAIRRVLAIEPVRPFGYIRDLPLARQAALVASLLATLPESARAVIPAHGADDPQAIGEAYWSVPPESLRRARQLARRLSTRAMRPLRRLRSHI